MGGATVGAGGHYPLNFQRCQWRIQGGSLDSDEPSARSDAGVVVENARTG